MRWEDLTFWEQTFWGMALVFTVLSVIQLVTALFGLELEQKSSAEEEYAHTTWFSARHAIFFFAFLGWAGALSHDRTTSFAFQLCLMILVSAIGTWVVSYVHRLLMNWSRANDFDPHQLLFKTALVQQTIPAHQSGHGSIAFVSNKKNRTITAITYHLTSIAIGGQVRIVEVVGADLVVVEPIGRQ